jgi:hypothetical protein
MSSREIWSRAGGIEVRDLLASLLASRMLTDSPSSTPLYVCSPYLTDFPLFDNSFGRFQSLFRERLDYGELKNILFSQVLEEISSRIPIRIISVEGEFAVPFLKNTIRSTNPNISGRYATDHYHEKGLLCPGFYLEGSMNFTYNGVYKNVEKITSHSPESPEGSRKISSATLEFNRHWESLVNSEIPRIR